MSQLLGEYPSRECSKCGQYCQSSMKFCGHCGHCLSEAKLPQARSTALARGYVDHYVVAERGNGSLRHRLTVAGVCVGLAVLGIFGLRRMVPAVAPVAPPVMVPPVVPAPPELIPPVAPEAPRAPSSN